MSKNLTNSTNHVNNNNNTNNNNNNNNGITNSIAHPNNNNTNNDSHSNNNIANNTNNNNGTNNNTPINMANGINNNNNNPDSQVRSRYKTFILSNGVFEVENRYEIREIIGSGAYGVVCSALDLKTNQLVAIKKIENVFDHRSLAKRTLRELKLVRNFKHENILSLQRVMRPHNNTNYSNVYMVSELMETDLACVIRSPQELTDEHCQFFIYQVLRGLKYIHSANVIHRDLKPRNLLVNSNCDLKICDFGLARLDDSENNERAPMSTYIATRWYRAPEVILGRKRYTKAVDMWSVGCILAELVGRKPIFPGRDSFHQITLIISVLGTPPVDPNREKHDNKNSNGPTDDYINNLPKKPKIPFRQLYPKASALACDLIDKLLTFEPENRLTVEEALNHPYLEELHCEEDEPTSEHFDFGDFYFEYVRTSKEDLKVLITQEIVNNHPEEHFQPPEPQNTTTNNNNEKDAQDKANKDKSSALDNFTQAMGKSLPKSNKKQRRKSF